MKRDKEIKSLVDYMRACRVKVIIRDYNIDESGSYEEETRIVRVNRKYNKSKTDIILTLLHEASHVKYAALFPENNYDGIEHDENGDYINVSKEERKKALKFEIESYPYIYDLVKEFDITIPLWKIQVAIAEDTYQYEYWTEHGEWPPTKKLIAMRNQLKKKYKK